MLTSISWRPWRSGSKPQIHCPIYLPDGDIRRFLSRPVSTAAWVAVFDDRVVGHVALNDSTSEPVMRAVDELGDDRPVLYVARLLVDPSARRSRYTNSSSRNCSLPN